MSSLNPPAEIVAALNFTGGFPSSKDLVPSVIMTIAYGLSLPLLIYRLFSIAHADFVLLRTALFGGCRIAMLALRAYMARNAYTMNVLIAELVMLSFGYLLLIEPVVALWYRTLSHSTTSSSAQGADLPSWTSLLTRLLRIMLLGSFITGIVASCQTSSSFSDSGNVIHSALDLRHASYILALIVASTLLVATLVSLRLFRLAVLPSAYLAIITLCLLVVGIYRVVQTFSSQATDDVRKPVAFWICQIFFEFVAYMSFLVVSLPEIFPTPKPTPVTPHQRGYAKMDDSEKGERSRKVSIVESNRTVRRLRSASVS